MKNWIFLCHVRMQDAQMLCVFHCARICIHLSWMCQPTSLVLYLAFSICVAEVNQPENLFVQTR